MEDRIKEQAGLQESISAFMQISALRNELVHENFAGYSLDKTPSEIIDLYRQARTFVNDFPRQLQEYIDT